MGRGSEPKPKGANRLSLNLLEQLSFYGAYHTNPINQLIHFVFVPTILFSILVWLARFQFGDLASVASHAGLSVPAALQGIPVSASAVVVVIYSLFYLCLDFFAGLSWAALIGMPLCWGAHVLRAHPQADTIAGVLQLVSWYMQIHPGHAVFEKRKPALMDSLVQAFALAPLFVWFELLFLLGYRPQLRQALKERVEAQLAALRAGGKAKKQ